MKKYIVPSIQVVNVENEAILAQSIFDPSTAKEYGSGRLSVKRRGSHNEDLDNLDEDFEDEDF